MSEYINTKLDISNLSNDKLRELGYRECTNCHELKPSDAFYKSKRRNGMSYACKVCHRKKIRGYRTVVDSYNWFYRRLEKMRTNARKRGLEFTLTVDDYKHIKGTENCYYCDEPTDIITLDRKDNALGYTPENVVGACFYCNRLKSDMFNEDKMKIIGKAVKMKHKRDKEKNVIEDGVIDIPIL